jgi:hypothetical protein
MKRMTVIVLAVFVFAAGLPAAAWASSWFDGIPRNAIRWIQQEVEETMEWEPNVQGKIFGDFMVNIDFDRYEDRYLVRIIDRSTGEMIAQYVDRQWKEFSEDEIMSALNSATPLEEMPATTTTTTDSESVESVVLFPGHDDEGTAPLVSSETPVASADRAGLRVMENVLLPKMRAGGKEAGEAAAQKPRLVGGNVTYEEFEYFGVDGSTFEVVAGAEKGFDQVVMGVYMPVSYVDTDLGNWNKLGLTGYAKKEFAGEKVDSALGLNVAVEQTWMDIDSIDDSFAYGAGPMGSLSMSFNNIEARFGANLLYMANTEYDAATIMTTGLDLGIPAGSLMFFDLYVYRNDNFDSENDYWVTGATASYLVSETFGISLGANTVTGYDDYDSMAFYLGGAWKF